MKRNLLLLIIFNVFFFMGLYYNRKKQTPTDQMISYYNWISRYDLYDYEESILKDGDVQKLHAIMGERGVEKMPYVIIMYDVYHKDVCEQLSNISFPWQTKSTLSILTHIESMVMLPDGEILSNITK